MTKMGEKSFLDEFEHAFEIRRLLRKKRYSKSFKFLVYYFDEKGARAITLRQLQESLLIPDRSNAFQILEGMVVMCILRKHRASTKVYYMKNPEWWDITKKEFEKIKDENRG